MKKKLTYRDVIEITKDRYHNDPTLRSKLNVENSVRCLYFNENGNKCAVGHFLIEENFNKTFNGESITQLLIDEEDYEMYMHKSVRHLQNTEFWDDLQNFHDIDSFWDEGGLNESGIVFYNKLINKYAN